MRCSSYRCRFSNRRVQRDMGAGLTGIGSGTVKMNVGKRPAHGLESVHVVTGWMN